MTAATRNQMLLALLAFAAGFVGLYHGYFDRLWSLFTSEDFSHCLLVPPLVGYFLWNNRESIAATPRSGLGVGACLLLAGLAMAVMGRLGALEMLAFISMWFSVAGAMFLALTTANWRNLLYPLIMLLFLIPFPPFLTQTLSFQLRLISSTMSVDLLNFLGVPAFQDGNIIDLGVQKLEVVDACSGLRYFFPMLIMAVVIGAMFHRSLRDRLLLFAASPLVAIVANVVRIVITGLLVKFVSPAMAEGFYHDFAGFVVYFVSLACLGSMSLLLRRFQTPPPPAAVPQPVEQSAASWRGSAVALVVAGALMLALWPLQDSLVGSIIVPQRKTFADFPMQIGAWQGKRLTLSPEELRGLGSDDYMLASFVNPQTGNQLQLLIPYYEQQIIGRTAHAPASCLLGSGWFITGKAVQPPAPDRGREFPVHQMVMTKQGNTMLSNFWFEQRGRIITSEYWNKFYIFWDAMLSRRTDGSLVRAEMFLRRDQQVEEAQKLLDAFLVEVRRLLPAYVPGSQAQAGNSVRQGG